MLLLKFLLTIGGVGMILVAAGILTHDLAMEIRYQRAFTAADGSWPAIPKIRWRTALAFRLLGWAPLVLAVRLAAGAVT
jgi:hypothetical protein